MRKILNIDARDGDDHTLIFGCEKMSMDTGIAAGFQTGYHPKKILSHTRNSSWSLYEPDGTAPKFQLQGNQSPQFQLGKTIHSRNTAHSIRSQNCMVNDPVHIVEQTGPGSQNGTELIWSQ